MIRIREFLIDIKSKFDDSSIFELVCKILDKNNSDYNFPVFDNFLENNLIEVQELTNNYKINILSRLTLLGDSQERIY